MQKIKTSVLSSAFLLLMLVFCSSNVLAQQKTVSGVVTEANGEPIIGASIQVKGTTAGAFSNIDGEYTVDLPAGANTLVVTYIGFEPMEVAITGSRVNVVMQESSTFLDEVVVIGYGSVRKKDLTGAVSSVRADDIQGVPVASASEAITGKLAGVQVTTAEGSPDAEIKIRVRGGGSITQDNSPLFIVDGFPVESINDIPPGDIESIDVLKDGSSTAIYGARGANGVVIVTTKSGKAGKVTVNYNGYYGIKGIAKTLDVLSPYDYTLWQYERAMLQDGKPDDYTKFFGNFQDMDLYKQVDANDWQDLVFGRTGYSTNHNVSIMGGSEKVRYAASYNYLKDKAIMESSDYQRHNLSLKLNTKPHEKVDVDFSVRLSHTEINGGGANEVNEVSSADSRMKYVMIYPPFAVNGLTNSDETDDGFNLYHPLEAIADNDRTQKRINLNLAGALTWELYKDLKFKTEIGYDDYRYNDARFYGKTTYYVKNVPAGDNQNKPAVRFANQYRTRVRNTNTLNYNFRDLFNSDVHNLTALAGHEIIYQKNEKLTSEVHGFPESFSFSDAMKLTPLGTPHTVDNFYSPDDVTISYFGRVNYDYDSKYLLTATLRADGSSKFSKGNQWGYFPSVAAAWRFSSESFMEGTQGWMDDAKLRLSYGTSGNNNIPSGILTQLLSPSNTTWVNDFPSYIASSKVMANPNLKWETTVTRNVGLDFVFLKSKLAVILDAYWNTTNDLLIAYPTAGTGYDTQYRNIGETENKGFEATVNYTIFDKKDYGLSVSANIGFNKNKINSLGGMDSLNGDVVTSGWASSEVNQDFIAQVGGSIGQMYGYINAGRYEVEDFVGYDEATGKWIPIDGLVDSTPITGGELRPGALKLAKTSDTDPSIITTDDKTVIGDANPVHTGGFSINGRAYGFDLSANFNWSYGNDVYNANKIEYTSTSKYHSYNMLSEMASGKRWTNLLADGTICNDPAQLAEMNKNTTLWSPYTGRYTFTDWAVEDGSFLRLATLTLGYTLPQAVVNKVNIGSCRFYVTGHNLFCWTNYSGFDPEVSTRRKTNLTPSVDYSAYPKSRQFVIGVNLSF